MATTKLFIITACLSLFGDAVVGQAWNQNPTYEPGKFGDVCDDTRPCNQARNLVCNRIQPYGTGRCDCKVQMYSNMPWVYNPTLQMCQDPNLPNLNPHHHYNNNYNPNQSQQQPQPPNPFGSNGGNGGGSWNGNGAGGGAAGGGDVSGVGTSCPDDRICILNLGSLSRCVYNRCQCFDTESQGKGQVKDYEGRCWKVAREGEACTDDQQCILGGTDLKCVQDSDNSYLKHCKCEGRGCRNEAAGLVTGTILLTSITTTLGLIAVAAPMRLLW